MSRISQDDKRSMYELAVEIIELQAENEASRAKGYDPDSTAICRLYDQSDSEFCASRIKSLLDELKETQEHNQRLRSIVGNPRKLFTCSSCEAEGLDEPLESRCHCMGEDAHWIESVVYQPEENTDGSTA